jgi:hypothetical protein
MLRYNRDMATRPSLIPAEPEELTPVQHHRATSKRAKNTQTEKAWLDAMAANISSGDLHMKDRLLHAIKADQLANLMRHHEHPNDESDDDA